MDSLLAVILRMTLRLALKPALSPDVPLAAQRRRLALLSRLNRLPRGVRVEAVHPGDKATGGVAGEWLHPAHAPVKAGRVLYLHGGAFCVGSPATHRALTAKLARDTGLPVFCADYRLAPEHPFPAALDDAHAAHRALAVDGPVIVAGDSAGGALALLLAQRLRDARETPSAALLLFSPLADLTLRDVPESVRGEALLSLPWVRAGIDAFRGAIEADDPRLSPLHGSLAGLPPTLVQWGEDDILAPGCARLVDALRSAGTVVHAEPVRDRWHVFPLHAGTLPSADAALARAAAFAVPHLEAATPARTSRHTAVVLGAGMSGLCMARTLKSAGISDFVVLEKSTGIGGTWWDNRYPGAQVDVPAPAYAFSFAPNREATQRFANAADIQRYQQRLAEDEGLLAHIRLGVAVESATWDESAGEWTIRTARGDVLIARFFIASTGPLSQPRWPDIKGLADFKGPKLHSARWPADDTALDGARVGIIGTGSTAVQIIPKLAARVSHLSVFQRTPNWVLPRLERRYGALDRWLSHLPAAHALTRRGWGAFLEWTRRGFDEGTFARRFMLALARWHRERQLRGLPRADAVRESLTPPYPLGCKRIIYANDYYPTFARANVALVTTGIARIVADGLVTTDGRHHALDALVCATGFDTANLLASLRIEGRDGRTLSDAWKEAPEAYRGTTVAGFPNLFLLLGPNTATGHTSTLFYIEAASEHALACMRRVIDDRRRAVEVRAEVMRAHNDALQARLAGSVWTRCSSWYRLESGRVAAIFPGFTPEYVRGTRQPDWRDYDFR